MQQQAIEYVDKNDKLIGQFVHDDQVPGKRPTVILYPAFEGLSQFSTDYAHRLAEKGYAVFVADIYGNGDTADTIEGCMTLITPFLSDRALVRRRSLAAFDVASKLDLVDTNTIGSLGFCFGGMCALECARSGAPVKSTLTAHGVLQKSDLPSKKMRGAFLILHGYQDPQAPPDSLLGFAEEMKAADVDDWTFTFFGTAQHSFTDPKTGTFDPEQEKKMGRIYHKVVAERTFRYVVDFFDETLK